MKKISDLNELMVKHLLGVSSKEEEAALRDCVDQDVIQEIEQSDDLADYYEIYSRIDEEQALLNMRQRLGLQRPVSRVVSFSGMFRYAAVFLLFIIGGIFLWNNRNSVTPPEIPDTVKNAMQHSMAAGRADAVILPLEQIFMEDVAAAGMADEGQEVQDTLQQHRTESTLVLSRSSMSAEQLLSAYCVSTRYNKEFWLTLDDGTLVHLNYNTRLIYPEKFGHDDRNVILDGEAYFMVAKDKQRPFVVHTPQGVVRVYGTEFMVNTTDKQAGDAASTTVTLIKGSVGVTAGNGSERKLKPGQQMSVVNDQMSVSDVDVIPYVAWNNGTFVFDDCTLMRLMSVISKWYGYEVVFHNDKARTKRFTGELDRYGEIAPVIESIEMVTGLSIKIQDDRIEIY